MTDINQHNKKVLIINYYWPPSGGSAVQRWLSFSNELVALGWDVYVVTVDEKYATYQLNDESLVNEIHPGVKVFTTKTLEPFFLYKFIFGKQSIPKPAFANESNPSFIKKASRFVRGNLFIPDPRKGWHNFAVKKAESLIAANNIPLVITAGPPHSTHFIGRTLKNKLHIKWIADFHDLWTDVIYYDLLYHLPAVKRIDRALEKKILEDADRLITVGEEYKNKLLSKSVNIPAEKIHISRIGYDEHLFPQKTVSVQDKFSIAYVGSIADFYHPEVFFRALQNVRRKFPQVPLQLRFVGVLSEGIRNAIRQCSLSDVLEETGYVSHKEAVNELLKATALLLVNPQTKDEKMVIPGKIYEYLAAEKTIINITVPDAEIASLIEINRAGKTFGRNMQAELEEYLIYLFTNWQENKTLDISNTNKSIYSRGVIAARLSSEVMLPLTTRQEAEGNRQEGTAKLKSD
jgi:glycosyltransferase involved in cell wall biosynthesis